MNDKRLGTRGEKGTPDKLAEYFYRDADKEAVKKLAHQIGFDCSGHKFDEILAALAMCVMGLYETVEPSDPMGFLNMFSYTCCLVADQSGGFAQVDEIVKN